MNSRTLPAALVVALMVALSVWAWPQAPDVIATHWGADGRPDGFGSKALGLLLLPVITAGLALMFEVIPAVDPAHENFAQMRGAYSATRMATLSLLAALHAGAVASAVGRPVDMAMITGVGAGGLYLVLGAVMGKIRPNYLFGVRTPWTLASKLAWTRTHRVCGAYMMALGAGVIGVAAWAPERAMTLLIAGSLGLVALSMGYSYRVWSTDPDRTTPGQVKPA